MFPLVFERSSSCTVGAGAAAVSRTFNSHDLGPEEMVSAVAVEEPGNNRLFRFSFLLSFLCFLLGRALQRCAQR